MYETISSINNVLNGFIWGVPAMVCIIGVGLYLSIRTGFIQIRKFPYALKNTIGKIFDRSSAQEGSITPFQAVCTALAATIGTGNIAGVAGAIAIGGPGAVFWMWISALLGMCTKFSEVTLAVHYRERNDKGEYIGMKEARKHTAWYLKGWQGAARYRNLCGSLSTMEDFYRLLETIRNEQSI